MGEGVSTIIIEPRLLVREALVSLIAGQSYKVVGTFAGTTGIGESFRPATLPRLVILGGLPADEAADAAGRIRGLWPAAKIILLFDQVSSTDFHKLLASEIDGCIPLFASPDTFVDTLQEIIAADLRILVLRTDMSSSIPCSLPRHEERHEMDLSSDGLTSSGGAARGPMGYTSSLRISYGLSQREEEILKGVVRGHSNKMIARTCGVTDATIKVHMKSILRKIRVANRTQAAIWALEQGYGADAKPRSPMLHPAVHGVAA